MYKEAVGKFAIKSRLLDNLLLEKYRTCLFMVRKYFFHYIENIIITLALYIFLCGIMKLAKVILLFSISFLHGVFQTCTIVFALCSRRTFRTLNTGAQFN